MFNDKLKMHGAMTLVLQKPNGEVEVTHKDNIIVNVGFDFIADAIGNAAARPAAMGWIALGSGTTAPDAAQIALVTEVSRAAAAYAHVAGTKVFKFSVTFGAGVATAALTEAAVFNDVAGGIMFDRVNFPVVNKGVDDVLEVIFTFSMT